MIKHITDNLYVLPITAIMTPLVVYVTQITIEILAA